jgi:hypothetical protein
MPQYITTNLKAADSWSLERNSFPLICASATCFNNAAIHYNAPQSCGQLIPGTEQLPSNKRLGQQAAKGPNVRRCACSAQSVLQTGQSFTDFLLGQYNRKFGLLTAKY